MQRSLLTVLGFAAATAAATLAVCWPGRTYADPPETFYGAGDVDDVSFTGEVQRDPSMKSGWAIKVTFENRGETDENCNLDTELTRGVINPGSRAGEPGVAVWHKKDKVMVPAHESVEKSYEIPQWMAAQLTANEKAMVLREKRIDAENNKKNPDYRVSMSPYTMYGVAFVKANG